MKNTRFAALAVLSGLIPGLAAAPALAQSAAPRVLTMSGQGEVRAAPDTVSLSAGVTSQAATAAAALTANTARMKQVFAALKALGVADRDMQTANFSVSPQYADNAGNQPARVTGYQVNNQVSVQLDDVGKLGAALDALVAARANQMNGISFTIRDPSPLLAQARAAAVADARTKAQAYASAAGVALGPVLSIGETGDEAPMPRFAPMAMMAAKAVPVAAGEESVDAHVTIMWEIH